MSEFQETANSSTTGTPRWVGLAVAVLGGVSLLGLGVAWSALNQAKTVEQSTQATVKQANDALAQRLAKADEINQQMQSDVKVVTDRLKLTQSELIAARKQNKNATTAVDQKVTSLATSVKAELATKANADDVNRLNGDVTGVKTDLDATKNSIQMARSEMGTLIARNHDEIDQLRRMGQRLIGLLHGGLCRLLDAPGLVQCAQAYPQAEQRYAAQHRYCQSNPTGCPCGVRDG